MKTEPYSLRLSQALLGSVAGTEHAASIVGDLYEASGRSRCSFCRDVLSAATALAVQALLRHPARTAARLTLSAALWVSCYLAVRLGLAWAGWLSITEPAALQANAAIHDCLTAEGLRGVVLAAALIAAGLLCGGVLGLWQRRAEASPALPLCAMFVAAAPALAVADLLATGSVSWHCLVTYFVVLPLCYALPLIGSAALTHVWQLSLFERDAQTRGHGERTQ